MHKQERAWRVPRQFGHGRPINICRPQTDVEDRSAVVGKHHCRGMCSLHAGSILSILSSPLYGYAIAFSSAFDGATFKNIVIHY